MAPPPSTSGDRASPWASHNNAVFQRGGYVDDIYAQVNTDLSGIIKLLTNLNSGQAPRITCLSSSHQDALNASRNLAERLQAHGYPLHVIIKQLQKADYNFRHNYIFSTPKTHNTNTNPPNPLAIQRTAPVATTQQTPATARTLELSSASFPTGTPSSVKTSNSSVSPLQRWNATATTPATSPI